MKKGLLFIAYHPGSLHDYKYLSKIDGDRSLHVLIIVRHPYTSDEIIKKYSSHFDFTIILPDIHYEVNAARGFKKYYQFMKRFRTEIGSILSDIKYYSVISDCSAFLPVNALLSELTKNVKCKNIISIREDCELGKKLNVLKTMRTKLYTGILGLYPVYDHKIFSHQYSKEPSNKIVRLATPFVKKRDPLNGYGREVPVYHIYKQPDERNQKEKSTVVFYSDTQLDNFHDLSKEEFEKRLKRFFAHLARRYENCKIVCKPHPQDQGKAMAGMENISYELYTGSLTSQMHLDLIANEVIACYSVSSTSVLYSAAMGIPSYSLYQYLDFKGELPKVFFENDEIKENPFLYNMKDLSDIGAVDSLTIEPMGGNPQEIWNEVLR